MSLKKWLELMVEPRRRTVELMEFGRAAISQIYIARPGHCHKEPTVLRRCGEQATTPDGDDLSRNYTNPSPIIGDCSSAIFLARVHCAPEESNSPWRKSSRLREPCGHGSADTGPGPNPKTWERRRTSGIWQFCILTESWAALIRRRRGGDWVEKRNVMNPSDRCQSSRRSDSRQAQRSKTFSVQIASVESGVLCWGYNNKREERLGKSPAYLRHFSSSSTSYQHLPFATRKPETHTSRRIIWGYSTKHTYTQRHSFTMSTEPILPEVSQTERHGYLFGAPISHSMSPLLHQTVYEGLGLNWAQYPLESRDMNLFLSLIKHPNFYGKPMESLYKY